MLRASFTILCFFFFSQTTFANDLFETPNQASPLNTMQSMLDMGTGCVNGSDDSCRYLTGLCDVDGDSDVWKICLIGGADEATKRSARRFFRSISIGAATENGDAALVHFMFKEPDDAWLHEYMRMRLIDGKWVLNSF
jgi:hypothetical protein